MDTSPRPLLQQCEDETAVPASKWLVVWRLVAYHSQFDELQRGQATTPSPGQEVKKRRASWAAILLSK
jgi:hypothetical protein